MNFIKLLAIWLITLPVFADNENVSLLIYGDSISAGYGMDKDEQWSEDLKVLFKKNNFNIDIYLSLIHI